MNNEQKNKKIKEDEFVSFILNASKKLAKEKREQKNSIDNNDVNDQANERCAPFTANDKLRHEAYKFMYPQYFPENNF